MGGTTQQVCGGEDKGSAGWLSPSPMRVLGLGVRWTGLTHCAYLLRQHTSPVSNLAEVPFRCTAHSPGSVPSSTLLDRPPLPCQSAMEGSGPTRSPSICIGVRSLLSWVHPVPASGKRTNSAFPPARPVPSLAPPPSVSWVCVPRGLA